MGNVFLIGGATMLFVATKKGFEYRWVMVVVFLVLFAGTIAYQVHQLNSWEFPETKVFQLLK